MAASTEQSRAELRKIDGVFDVPNWLDLLDASLTFPSGLVELQRAEGEALLAAAHARKQVLDEIGQRDAQDLDDHCPSEGEPLFNEGGVVEYLGYFESMGGELDDSDFLEHRDFEKAFFATSKQLHVAERFAEILPSPAVRNTLMIVARKLDDAMQQLHAKVASPEGTDIPSYFVRLSSRSPKDAAAVNELAFLEEALKQRASQKTLNGRLGLFCDLFLRGMRVQNGLEAVHLLLASKRVTDDIFQAIEAEDQCGVPYDLSLVVRTWSPGVREDAEFRGFMSIDGQLVALSQYNEFFYQPELEEHREAISQALVEFVETSLRPKLLGTQFLPCVLDLVILQRGGLHEPFDPLGEVRVVELNPANERTSPALFDKDEVWQWVVSESTLKDFRLTQQIEYQDGRFLQDRIDEAQRRWKAQQLFQHALS
mmetsp:Transcript_106170/g.193149  ORF Transcript_106170/g.193149 Transcript_106170/m.193149 type:complete len:426 (-) Transcript_106170:29-1306(-)